MTTKPVRRSGQFCNFDEETNISDPSIRYSEESQKREDGNLAKGKFICSGSIGGFRSS
jgi:hypothetical protein